MQQKYWNFNKFPHASDQVVTQWKFCSIFVLIGLQQIVQNSINRGQLRATNPCRAGVNECRRKCTLRIHRGRRGRPSLPPQLPVCLGARCKGDRMHRWRTAIKSSNCFTKRMWMSNTRASAACRVPLRASRFDRSSWSSNEKAVPISTGV